MRAKREILYIKKIRFIPHRPSKVMTTTASENATLCLQTFPKVRQKNHCRAKKQILKTK